jgi:hypothetical protein
VEEFSRPGGTVENGFQITPSIVPAGLETRSTLSAFPAVNCRAIVESPSGRKEPSASFSRRRYSGLWRGSTHAECVFAFYCGRNSCTTVTSRICLLSGSNTRIFT